LPVKLSKMNRFMIEVLPTDWSPSITILHLTAGAFYISNYIMRRIDIGNELLLKIGANLASIIGKQ
jgi:hypothetical protein